MSAFDFLQSFASLPTEGCNATYIWVDASGERMRSKTRRINPAPKSVKDCPIWNFDGSSTGQAESGLKSDVILIPVALYKDPILRGDNKLVLCECYTVEDKPALGNKRASCVKAMEKSAGNEPWFALEQEFVVMDKKTGRLIGWPETGFPEQGPFYCGINLDARARALVMSHSLACEFSGVPTSGTNAEVLLGQWEYQVGPSQGIKYGDDVWVSRYLLESLAELLELEVTFDPKPAPGYNGSGGHTNFSTKQTRENGGIKVIEEYCESLRANHEKHISVYDPNGGADNARRLTGTHETSSMSKFSYGVSDRGASVRINASVVTAGCGYLEDRRPASNADPYSVSEALVRTCCLKEF